MSASLSRPDERLAHERARYLETTTDLRAAEADAVAYAELGYSSSGIAKQIDSGESTVRAYLARTIAGYGPEAVHARATGDFETDRDLKPADADDVEDGPGAVSLKSTVDRRSGDVGESTPGFRCAVWTSLATDRYPNPSPLPDGSTSAGEATSPRVGLLRLNPAPP